MKEQTHTAIATSRGRKVYYLTDAEAALIEHFRWEIYCKSIKEADKQAMRLCTCLQDRHLLIGYAQGDDGHCAHCRGFYRALDQLTELLTKGRPPELKKGKEGK